MTAEHAFHLCARATIHLQPVLSRDIGSPWHQGLLAGVPTCACRQRAAVYSLSVSTVQTHSYSLLLAVLRSTPRRRSPHDSMMRLTSPLK